MKTSLEIGHKPTPVKVVAVCGFNGTSAQGIVTRMGHDLGHGGEAIEPGPVGMRPFCSRQFRDQTVVRSFAFDLQTLVTRCEEAAGATGGACDARGARRAVPLGNTGTTTVGGAQ